MGRIKNWKWSVGKAFWCGGWGRAPLTGTGQVLGLAGPFTLKAPYWAAQAGMPNPGPFASSLQLLPTAFPLDVFTSKPGLVTVPMPGWRGQECVCLCGPASLPLTPSPYLLVSSIPQPMGRAGAGRASQQPSCTCPTWRERWLHLFRAGALLGGLGGWSRFAKGLRGGVEDEAFCWCLRLRLQHL